MYNTKQYEIGKRGFVLKREKGCLKNTGRVESLNVIISRTEGANRRKEQTWKWGPLAQSFYSNSVKGFTGVSQWTIPGMEEKLSSHPSHWWLGYLCRSFCLLYARDACCITVLLLRLMGSNDQDNGETHWITTLTHFSWTPYYSHAADKENAWKDVVPVPQSI